MRTDHTHREVAIDQSGGSLSRNQFRQQSEPLLEVPTDLPIGFYGTLHGAHVSVVHGLHSTELSCDSTPQISFLPQSYSLETVTSASTIPLSMKLWGLG